jgi:hypothetical protein
MREDEIDIGMGESRNIDFNGNGRIAVVVG